jgi:murein DD-endopeptidase MepM/ murein hydrolase activator NlpD
LQSTGSQPDALSVTVSNQQSLRTTTASPNTPATNQSISAGLAATNDPNLRVVAAGATQPGTTADPLSNLVMGPPAPVCDVSHSTLYCVYTVLPNDNLSTIANKFGLKTTEDVASWELLVHSNKPDIVSEDDLLQIGQQLRIPTANAVVHTVLSSQTLTDIAEQFDVTMDEIAGVAANGIGNADTLAVGQELLIPNPKRFTAPAPILSPSSPAASAAAAITGPRSNSGFMWPTSGPISSYFGPGHPLGIDVDLFSNPNAPIGAAMAGTVTFAGGNPCCSYGLYVVVDHGNGFQTLYAHFSKVSVSVGQRVSQGQVLGNGGRTGYATGNHLHFELLRNGVVVNPLSYLP